MSRKQREQTKINHNYFKKWSENMAYIFGLWYADGYIQQSERGYYFSIKLNKSDKYLLKDVLNEFESEHKIYKNRDGSCHITFSSKTIYEDIINLGGCERKSLSDNFPIIPKTYLHHFIRGIFDGDGSISFNKCKGCYVASISGGSKIYLNSLLNAIKSFDNNIGGSICKNSKNPNSNTYKVVFGKRDTKKLCEIIYKNANMKLLRKFEKAETIRNTV